MKKEWNDVREFHEKFGHPVAGVPKMVDKKRALSRGKWMNEEVAEFLVAEDIYEQADAMIDLIYFALGTLVEMGLEADELFDIVQQANMSKLWPDGKPHYNPKDGKVIKIVRFPGVCVFEPLEETEYEGCKNVITHTTYTLPTE